MSRLVIPVVFSTLFLCTFQVLADSPKGSPNSVEPVLQAVLRSTQMEFAYGEQVDLHLEITNRSNQPLRIMKPRVYINQVDPRNTVAFVIENSKGQRVQRSSHVSTKKIQSVSDVKHSVLLQPGESSKTSHGLFPIELREKRGGTVWSYHYISKNSFGSYEKFLLPGSYSIRLKYYLSKESETPFWSPKLTEAHGEPWTGEISSNSIKVRVLPKE